MKNELAKKYDLIPSERKINDFISNNESTLEILNAIEPQLDKHFPNTKFSLEVCDRLEWTTEIKLLLNVHITEEMFFNGMLNHFNEIYAEIEPLIEDMLCPIVLFPKLQNQKYETMTNNCAINLIARTAYFNNDYDGSVEREILIRDIPKEQQKIEIMEYCETHDDIFAPDIEEDLKLDFYDICEILDELEKEGKIVKNG
ncbi:hypothetical protein [Methanobrevibacter sp.]